MGLGGAARVSTPGGRAIESGRGMSPAVGIHRKPSNPARFHSVATNAQACLEQVAATEEHRRRGGRISARRWLARPSPAQGQRRPKFSGLTPSAVLQRREGLLNSSLTVAVRQPAGGAHPLPKRAYLHIKHRTAPTRLGRSMWKATKQLVRGYTGLTGPLHPWAAKWISGLDLALVIRAEQAPNPDSRVKLNRHKDAIGMPRAVLDWRLSALDVDSVAGLVGALDRESRRLGLGVVEPATWLADGEKRWVTDELISAHPIGGFHHMGTTRMANDPRRGVTDGWGRVHGLPNLHIAGSSLFPTAGWANPTLTILALSLRTADRIADELHSSTGRLSVIRTGADGTTGWALQ